MQSLARVHEHIVVIKKQFQPELTDITAAALLNLFEIYAEHPDEFIDSLQSATAVKKHQSQKKIWSRKLIFSNRFCLEDEVELIDNTLVIHVPGSASLPESRLTMRLEEREGGGMFVRFIYDEADNEMLHNAQLLALRKQAWENKDREVINLMLEAIAQAQ